MIYINDQAILKDFVLKAIPPLADFHRRCEQN